jgi:ABC-type polysaccharide/polyol phosphate transport system ATPase subunit
VEAVNLSKCYRPHSAVEFAPIPWRPRRRRRLRKDDKPTAGSLVSTTGDDDGDDDDDFDDDDLDLGDAGEDLARGPVLPDREIWALRDVNFRLTPGSVLGVIGANGSGKSTLIRILQRVSPPTSGHAVTRGRVAPAYSVAANMIDANKSGVACIFRLARFFGVPREVAEAAVEPIRDLTELGDLLELPTRTYSSGQLPRLAYAISLCLDPDILLTDGIPSVGDPAFRVRALAALRARIDQGLTMVLATHDSKRLRELCTEALLLKEGRVEALGTADEVASRYEAAFAAEAAVRARSAPKHRPSPAVDASDVIINTVGVYDMNGQPREAMRSTDDALLELTFEVRRAPKRLRCVVALVADGATAVRLAQPTHYDAEEPGVYAASVHLPPRTVPMGTYEGKARILELIDEERRTLDQAEFELESLATGEPVPRSVSAPKLTWEVVQLGPSTESVHGGPE